MSRILLARPLTREAFAPFGDVIDAAADLPRLPINGGRARRLPPQARAQVSGANAAVAITLVEADPYSCPLPLAMVERHPLGSQAFFPLTAAPFLVVVCPDEGGTPGTPEAFVTAPWQGVNYTAGTWHGVLTPLDAPQTFVCVDRAGQGVNLEEHWFAEPFVVHLADPSGSRAF